jgi:hypothetical protein
VGRRVAVGEGGAAEGVGVGVGERRATNTSVGGGVGEEGRKGVSVGRTGSAAGGGEDMEGGAESVSGRQAVNINSPPTMSHQLLLEFRKRDITKG